MDDLLNEFIDGIDECIDELPATASAPEDPDTQPLSVEDYGI